jgi:hypothetical protein
MPSRSAFLEVSLTTSVQERHDLAENRAVSRRRDDGVCRRTGSPVATVTPESRGVEMTGTRRAPMTVAAVFGFFCFVTAANEGRRRFDEGLADTA